MRTIITSGSGETKRLGGKTAERVRGGGVVCLVGDLGAGKTTFAQGFLKTLGAKGPYTSPTFVVMKNYKKKFPDSNRRHPDKSAFLNIYHVDAYRVSAGDILNLGWKEIIADKKNIIIVEWADRVKKIMPRNALWVKFEWLDGKKRRISL